MPVSITNAPRRWIKRLVCLLLSVVALAFVGLLVANVLDYRRYYWATHFEQTEGLDKVRELAHTCFDLAKEGNGHLEVGDYPPNIAKLNPSWVSIGRHSAQIGLYGDDDHDPVYLVFENYGGNLVVEISEYTGGGTDSRLIYVQDQAAYEVLHPKDRIVTLGQGTMSEYYEWIVLSNEVRLTGLPSTGGAAVLGRRPISESEKEEIEKTVKAIPQPIRGRYFTGGGADGIVLEIRFAPDGRRGPADIAIANTWLDEVGPLVDLVARLSPPGAAPRFRSIVEEELKMFSSHHQTSITWAARAKLGTPPRVWWCLWPAFVRKTPKA